MLAESLFDAGELSINYAESAGSGAPLVALHGLTMNWQGQQWLIGPLAETHHIYACDLRGHGKSGRSRSGYRIVDYVNDTTAFIQKHIGQPTILFGYSTGAVVALLAAARLPNLVSALILLEPPLFFWNASIRAFQSNDVIKWITWVHETLTPPASLEAVVTRVKESSPDMADSEAQEMAANIHPLDPAAIATFLNDQVLEGLDLRQVMQQVGCPTLLLHGEPHLGSLVRAEDVAFVRDNLPESVIVQIKNTGHVPDVQEQAEVLNQITAFLNTL